MEEKNYQTLKAKDAEEFFKLIEFRKYDDAWALISPYMEADAFKAKSDKALFIAVSAMADWFAYAQMKPEANRLIDTDENEADALDTPLAVFFLSLKAMEEESDAEMHRLIGKALAIAENADDRSAIACAHIMLGDISDDDIEKYYNKAAEALREAYGDDDWRTILSESEAETFNAYDDCRKSIRVLEDLVSRAEETDKTGLLKARVLMSLAEVYQEDEQTEKSTECQEEAYHLYSQHGIETSEILSNLVMNLLAIGKYKKAEELAESNYETLREKYGDTDERTLQAYQPRLEVQRIKGDDGKLLSLAREHYDLLLQTKASLSSSVIAVYPILYALRKQEKTKESIDALITSFCELDAAFSGRRMEIMGLFIRFIFSIIKNTEITIPAFLSLKEKYSGDDEMQINIDFSLSALYSGLKRYDEAIETCQAAVELSEKHYGKDSIEYAKALKNLALMYYEGGNKKRAVRYMRQAIGAYEGKDLKLMDIDDVNTMHVAIASYDMDTENYEEASRHWMIAYEHFHETGKDEDALHMMENYASAISNLDRFDEAIECYRKIYDERKLNNDDESDIAFTASNLATAYSNIDEHEKSYRFFMESYEIYRKIEGKSSREANDSLISAAKELHYMGHDKDALLLASKAYNSLAAEDTDLKKDCLSVLFICNDSLGNRKKAKEYIDKMHRQFPETDYEDN